MSSGIARRGIVLAPEDFSLDWVPRMVDSGLNVLGLHMQQSRDDLLPFLDSAPGEAAVRRARASGLDVEYEIHALSLLLPREHFAEHPEWFRMDTRGDRVANGNLCVASADALAVVCRNAQALARRLTPSTNRYYLWPDDGAAWCHCPECQVLTPSDQNVVVMNALLQALRCVDPAARLACLAYHSTLSPPEAVVPEPGLFLEWAPIARCYRHCIDDPGCAVNREHAISLVRLLAAFTPGEAQVLEYWMDASMFSRWRRPAVKLPFDPEIMKRDVAWYASLGIRSLTSFGCFLDADYVRRHDEPPIRQYGGLLCGATVEGH